MKPNSRDAPKDPILSLPNIKVDLQLFGEVVERNEPGPAGVEAAIAARHGVRPVVQDWLRRVFLSEARGRGDLKIERCEVEAARRLLYLYGQAGAANDIMKEFAGRNLESWLRDQKLA